jgi:methyl-accepting chemotaxis protein
MVCFEGLRRFRIRSRLFGLLVLSCLATVFVGGYLSCEMAAQVQEMRRFSEFGVRGILKGTEGQAAAQQAVVGVHQAFGALTREEVLTRLDGVGGLVGEVRAALDGYAATVEDGTGRQAVEKARTDFRTWQALLENLSRMTDQGASTGMVKAYMEENSAKTDRVLADFRELVRISEENLRETETRVYAKEARARTTGLIVMVAAVIFLLAAGLAVIRSITAPLGRIAGKTREIAENLDLTFRHEEPWNDEIASVARSIVLLVGQMDRAMSSVARVGAAIDGQSRTFSATAQQANAAVQEVRANVEETSDRIGQVASGTEEVNASVEEVAAGAQTAANRSSQVAARVDQARREGEEGDRAVSEAVRAVAGVARDAVASREKVLALAELARKIQGFVGSIGRIADQTNLLALNAAIEAARAGEHGRGFAVVAEEVRKLAEESSRSAESIRELAGAIGGELGGVVQAVGHSAEEAQRVQVRAEGAQRSIDAIQAHLAEIASASQDMAAVSEEQAAASEEITSVVATMTDQSRGLADSAQAIRQEMEQVSRVAGQIAEGSQDLAGMADELEREVKRFRLSGGMAIPNRAIAGAESKIALPGRVLPLSAEPC